MDTSVLLSASGSSKGASRFIFENYLKESWHLTSSLYCKEEAIRNLSKLEETATNYFHEEMVSSVQWVKDCVVMDYAVVFPKAKDKPVLLTALENKCEYLLTLDREDFHGKLGKQFYGMRLRTPGEFLFELREKGILCFG